MVTNDLVICTLNGFAEQEQAEQQQPAGKEPLEQEVEPLGDTGATASPDTVRDTEAEDDVPELEPQGDEDESDDEAEEEEEAVLPLRRSARQEVGIKPPERYLHAPKVGSKEWKEEGTKKAIEGEVTQIFKDLKALDPVLYTDIPKNAEILSSHMFAVDKFMANDKYDKTKTRIVTHGNE
jgi:hypothetical protein